MKDPKTGAEEHTFTATTSDSKDDELRVLGDAFQMVYGKPLPWHRWLFYSFEENQQWYKDKVSEYIVKNTVVLIDGKPLETQSS